MALHIREFAVDRWMSSLPDGTVHSSAGEFCRNNKPKEPAFRNLVVPLRSDLMLSTWQVDKLPAGGLLRT